MTVDLMSNSPFLHKEVKSNLQGESCRQLSLRAPLQILLFEVLTDYSNFYQIVSMYLVGSFCFIRQESSLHLKLCRSTLRAFSYFNFLMKSTLAAFV